MQIAIVVMATQPVTPSDPFEQEVRKGKSFNG
jgi:hypothetical protein